MMNRVLKNRIRSVVVAALSVVVSGHVFAEVVTDGTLGVGTSLTGPDFSVTADLGQMRGANLFHSFSFFNIATGESATFSGPGTVSNIVSRVTGGTVSSIDGALNSTIPGANLYLINPSGVIFGENASLNVTGSFHASTASYLVLSDGGRFDAVTPANSVLTSAPPGAFGFLDGPAGISVTDTRLQVEPGKTLSLVGGDITTQDALLYAPGGTVQVASVASAGEVGVDVSTLDVDTYGQMGTIDVSHPGSLGSRFVPNVGFVGNVDASGDDGGTVVIRGGQFVLDKALVFADSKTGDGGHVDIAVSDLLRATNGSTISADAQGAGQASEITVVASRIELVDGGRLQMDNYTSDPGGTMDVTADTITIEGKSAPDISLIGNQESGLFAASFGSGDGGNVNVVATTELSVGGGGKIELNTGTGGGSAGTLSVMMTDKVSLHDGGLVEADTRGTGNAGNVVMAVRELEITGGGNISTKSLSSGNAGNIQITATDSVSLSGAGENDPSGIYSNAFSEGDGGQIQIVTADLTVTDGALIQAGVGENQDGLNLPPATATTRAGSIDVQAERVNISGTAQVSTQSENAGQAGDINIAVSDELNINSPSGAVQSGIFSTAAGTGAGGSITITGGKLAMNGGAINVSSANTGDAGDITASVGSVSMSNGAQISTSVAGTGNGGLLNVESGGIVTIAGQADDGFQTGLYSLTEGSGTGGAIEVSALNVLIANKGTINSESTSSGNAGDVHVAAVSTVELDNASINTSAANADGGNIKVTATDKVYLKNSEITAAVGGGEGDGGNVTIDPEFVVLSSSRILASAVGGDGGNITIVTDHFVASPDSVLDASSELGIDGSINIVTPDEEISTDLVDLPTTYLDASGLLRERCSTSHQGATSSFVVAGRDSLPTTPGSGSALLSSVSDISSGPASLTRYSPQQQFMGASLAASTFGCTL